MADKGLRLMEVFPCGCLALTEPVTDGKLIIREFVPVCYNAKQLGTNITEIRSHFNEQKDGRRRRLNAKE